MSDAQPKTPKKGNRHTMKYGKLLKEQRKLRTGSKKVFSRQRLSMMTKRAMNAIGLKTPEHGKDYSAMLSLASILRAHGSNVVDTANMTIVAGGSGITITPKRMEAAIGHYRRQVPLTPAHDWTTLRRAKKEGKKAKKAKK